MITNETKYTRMLAEKVFRGFEWDDIEIFLGVLDGFFDRAGVNFESILIDCIDLGFLDAVHATHFFKTVARKLVNIGKANFLKTEKGLLLAATDEEWEFEFAIEQGEDFYDWYNDYFAELLREDKADNLGMLKELALYFIDISNTSNINVANDTYQRIDAIISKYGFKLYQLLEGSGLDMYDIQYIGALVEKKLSEWVLEEKIKLSKEDREFLEERGINVAIHPNNIREEFEEWLASKEKELADLKTKIDSLSEDEMKNIMHRG